MARTLSDAADTPTYATRALVACVMSLIAIPKNGDDTSDLMSPSDVASTITFPVADTKPLITESETLEKSPPDRLLSLNEYAASSALVNR